MDLQMIVTPIVGSVIGYTTNWFAIKMLFKPHKAHYIGKVKMPFTPGLIPRERERIAKSLGDAVGNNLLTEEVIMKELTNESIINSLKDYVMNDLLGSSISIGSVVSKVFSDEDEFYLNISEQLSKTIVEYLESNEEIKGHISTKIASSITPETKINELLGEDTTKQLNDVLVKNKLEIANGICVFLAEEEMASKIKELIGNVMAEKLGGLAAMFVEPNSLYESILDFVRTHLEVEENQDEVVAQIAKVMNNLLTKPVGEVLDTQSYITTVSNISDMVYAQIIGFIKSDGFNDIIKELIIKVSAMEIELPDHMKSGIESSIEETYINFAKSRLPIFLEQFNVTGIVESEINNFSVQQVEDLIFKIVDKELKAITWLGALLGFGMGLVTLFF